MFKDKQNKQILFVLIVYCLFACLEEWKDGRLAERLEGWLDGWKQTKPTLTLGRLEGWLDGWIAGRPPTLTQTNKQTNNQQKIERILKHFFRFLNFFQTHFIRTHFFVHTYLKTHRF